MRELSPNEFDAVTGAGPCDGCAYAIGIGGGAIAGAKSGAFFGAKLGSFGGPVGMGIGAALGGLAGAAIAYQAVNAQ